MEYKRVEGEGLRISHLLFVDDVLVFSKSNEDHITYLTCILTWFDTISRLKINFILSLAG